MRVFDYFNTGQLDEHCDWVKLEGDCELYERRMNNLKLLIHSESETCEVYPLKGYEHNPISENRRGAYIGLDIGFSKNEELYHKEAILEYLNQFFPNYISVDVYLLEEDVCFRRSVYTYGKGFANEFFRDGETHQLRATKWKNVEFEYPKDLGPHTLDAIYRKIVSAKKIDTIVKIEGDAKENKASLQSFYVYEHYYYDEQQQKEIVFYVGKGTGEAKGSAARIYSEYRNKFWQEIVDSLNKKGVEWKYRIVGFFNSNKEALEFELKLQEDYWKKGQCLGCADLRRRHKYNEELERKRSCNDSSLDQFANHADVMIQKGLERKGLI